MTRKSQVGRGHWHLLQLPQTFQTQWKCFFIFHFSFFCLLLLGSGGWGWIAKYTVVVCEILSHSIQSVSSFWCHACCIISKTRICHNLKINTSQHLFLWLLVTQACGRRAGLRDSLANQDYGISTFNFICSVCISQNADKLSLNCPQGFSPGLLSGETDRGEEWWERKRERDRERRTYITGKKMTSKHLPHPTHSLHPLSTTPRAARWTYLAGWAPACGRTSGVLSALPGPWPAPRATSCWPAPPVSGQQCQCQSRTIIGMGVGSMGGYWLSNSGDGDYWFFH